jgi:hypothetical protein
MMEPQRKREGAKIEEKVLMIKAKLQNTRHCECSEVIS